MHYVAHAEADFTAIPTAELTELAERCADLIRQHKAGFEEYEAYIAAQRELFQRSDLRDPRGTLATPLAVAA